MAADNIREVQSAIVAVRAQASALGAEISKQLLALESALTHSVRDLEENHGLKLRDISTKHEEWSTQYERKLVDLAAQVKALEKLAHEAPHAEELRVISQDLSDLAQLVNESELGMAGDIAKLSGETLDHADLLASIGSAVRSLEARVKDASSVSTEFSGIVTRVDSKANMLSQVQADILQRIQAIEAQAVAERSPSANSLDHEAPPRPKQSRQSKSGKVAGKKRGIPPAGAKTTPRASAQTKARTRR
ncbi:MAG TPA: hypothetical protein VEB21_14420, partial [Terriglobales bacterium]|nr:hypothetical protein [Terriglobales bacterium]